MSSLFASGKATPSGALAIQPIRAIPAVAPKIVDVLKRGMPSKNLNPAVNTWRKANMFSLFRAASKLWVAEQIGVQHLYGSLYLTALHPTGDTSELRKEYADILPFLNGMDFFTWASMEYGLVYQRQALGLAGLRVVTDAGVQFIVDAFQDSVEVEILKYHALGTGSTAEAAGDTALVTELTTEYTGNVRATGSLTEGASANIYRTVGTNTLDGTPGAALREHGILSQAATGGGTLLDRTVYAAITLSSGDGLQSTYDLTLPSGS